MSNIITIAVIVIITMLVVTSIIIMITLILDTFPMIKNNKQSGSKENVEYSKDKQSGRKKSVEYPKDRNGVPINIGDWLMFDEGPIHVISLTLYEDGGWSAGSEEDDYASDNLSGGEVIPIWK